MFRHSLLILTESTVFCTQTTAAVQDSIRNLNFLQVMANCIVKHLKLAIRQLEQSRTCETHVDEDELYDVRHHHVGVPKATFWLKRLQLCRFSQGIGFDFRFLKGLQVS